MCIEGTTARATGVSVDPNLKETDVLQTKAAPIDDVIRKRMVNDVSISESFILTFSF